MKFSLFAGLLVGLMLANPTVAGELASPTGPVVLEVSGSIANTNGNGVADFDMAMLAAMESRDTVTSTPWYDGAKTIQRPPGLGIAERSAGVRHHAAGDGAQRLRH